MPQRMDLAADAAEIEKTRDELAWERLRKLVEAAVDVIDRKDLCYRLDVAGSQLSDAIAQRGKHIQLRWVVVIGKMLQPGPLARALAAALVEAFGFGVVELPDPDPQAALRELREAVMAEFGPAGTRLVDQRRKAARHG